MVHIDAADAGVGEVGSAGGDEARDDAAEFVGGVLLYLYGVETYVEEGVWQVSAQEGNVSSPSHVEECEAFYLGEGCRHAVRVPAAVVYAVGAVAKAPLPVDGQQEAAVVCFGYHRMAALGVYGDGIVEMAGAAVDGDGRRAGVCLDIPHELVCHLCYLPEECHCLLRPQQHIGEYLFSPDVDGEVEHSAPVDVSHDISVSCLQGIDKRHEAAEGGRAERLANIEVEGVAVCTDDLRRRVFIVFDFAAEHL